MKNEHAKVGIETISIYQIELAKVTCQYICIPLHVYIYLPNVMPTCLVPLRPYLPRPYPLSPIPNLLALASTPPTNPPPPMFPTPCEKWSHTPHPTFFSSKYLSCQVSLFLVTCSFLFLYVKCCFYLFATSPPHKLHNIMDTMDYIYIYICIFSNDIGQSFSDACQLIVLPKTHM